MGTGVLAPPPSPGEAVRLFAHCLNGTPGGVGLAAINLGSAGTELPLGAEARLFVLQASPLDSGTLTINGTTPRLEADGALSGVEGVAASGSMTLPGQSITFVELRQAGNPACR